MRTKMYTQDIIDLCTCSHRTASDVFVLLKKKFPRVGQATVYRTLSHLVEEGLLAKYEGLDAHAYYEVVDKPHGHLIDQKTGAIIDIELPHDIATQLGLPKGFTACRVDLKVYGSFETKK